MLLSICSKIKKKVAKWKFSRALRVEFGKMNNNRFYGSVTFSLLFLPQFLCFDFRRLDDAMQLYKTATVHSQLQWSNDLDFDDRLTVRKSHHLLLAVKSSDSGSIKFHFKVVLFSQGVAHLSDSGIQDEMSFRIVDTAAKYSEETHETTSDCYICTSNS